MSPVRYVIWPGAIRKQRQSSSTPVQVRICFGYSRPRLILKIIQHASNRQNVTRSVMLALRWLCIREGWNSMTPSIWVIPITGEQCPCRCSHCWKLLISLGKPFCPFAHTKAAALAAACRISGACAPAQM